MLLKVEQHKSPIEEVSQESVSSTCMQLPPPVFCKATHLISRAVFKGDSFFLWGDPVQTPPANPANAGSILFYQ